MAIQITTLSENTANAGYLAEWGLSILITTKNLNILMDTGRSLSATYNADALGIDLSRVDKIVLSHGHYDHTGGLRHVLRRTGEVEVIAHPDIWAAKYTRLDDQELYIGIPFRRAELEGLGARFKLTRDPVKLGDDIMTTGEVPMTTRFEKIDPELYIKDNDTLKPDPLADDLALIIDSEAGLIVILGCGHRGVINTLRHARKLTANRPVYAVVGGSHLFRASEDQINKTVDALKEMGIKKLGLCHCTGFAAAARLYHDMADVFWLNNAGTRLTLP